MDSQKVVTRFAPSPTGYLHLGHAYSALCASHYARENGGTFLLRFEDIDHTRVRSEYYAQILDDLDFLGISWDEEPIKQSERLDLYHSYFLKLVEQGVLYQCFCTRKEIELQQINQAPHAGEHQLYSGVCRSLEPQEVQKKIESEVLYCWRLNAQKLKKKFSPLSWENGEEVVVGDLDLLGDVIIARKDINLSYHLCVVVDDFLQGVTDVVRGKDLWESTHVHVGLQKVFGFSTPYYHHHDLIKDKNGERLAKRNKALSLKELRAQGSTKDDIYNLLGL